jgi:steroid delta-isomerase-like uncharacterized protein
MLHVTKHHLSKTMADRMVDLVKLNPAWFVLFAACAARADVSPTPRSKPMLTARSTPADHEAAIRQIYEVCLNTGNLELAPRLFADDYVGPTGERGPAGFATTIQGLRTGMPDIRVEIEDLTAGGDRVWVRWRWVGTHRGMLRGFPATGRRVENTGMSMYELRDGLVVRSWVESDRLGFLQQIGAVADDAGLRAAAAAREPE